MLYADMIMMMMHYGFVNHGVWYLCNLNWLPDFDVYDHKLLKRNWHVIERCSRNYVSRRKFKVHGVPRVNQALTRISTLVKKKPYIYVYIYESREQFCATTTPVSLLSKILIFMKAVPKLEEFIPNKFRSET